MPGEFHDFGTDDALVALGLEKRAFVGALLNVGRAAAAPIGRMLMQTGAGRALAPAAKQIGSGAMTLGRGLAKAPKAMNTAVERGVTQGAMGAAKRLGASKATQKMVGQKAFGAVRGMPKEVATQAGMGGLMMGGLGAATAEEGQRWDAFKSGLGEGALFGGLSGVAGGAMRNARRGALTTQAKHLAKTNPAALKGMSPQAAANKQLNQGMMDTIKGMRTGAGPMGRAGNIADTAGMVGQFGAEMYLPGMALGAVGMGEEAAPAATRAAQQIRTAAAKEEPQDKSLLDRLPRRYLGSALGSASGYAAGGIPMAIARESGHLKGPWGAVARGVIPALTGITGGLTGYTLGSKFDKPPALVQDLQQVDFDRLLKHYKKDSPGK